MPVLCVAYNCDNDYRKGFKMFSFPSDPARKEAWIKAVHRPHLKYAKDPRHLALCEIHFNESDLELFITQSGVRKVLKKNAIPSKFLPKFGTKRRDVKLLGKEMVMINHCRDKIHQDVKSRSIHRSETLIKSTKQMTVLGTPVLPDHVQDTIIEPDEFAEEKVVNPKEKGNAVFVSVLGTKIYPKAFAKEEKNESVDKSQVSASTSVSSQKSGCTIPEIKINFTTNVQDTSKSKVIYQNVESTRSLEQVQTCVTNNEQLSGIESCLDMEGPTNVAQEVIIDNSWSPNKLRFIDLSGNIITSMNSIPSSGSNCVFENVPAAVKNNQKVYVTVLNNYKNDNLSYF